MVSSAKRQDSQTTDVPIFCSDEKHRHLFSFRPRHSLPANGSFQGRALWSLALEALPGPPGPYLTPRCTKCGNQMSESTKDRKQ